MIEVEKKFRPTEEQLKQLLEGAEFLSEKTLHDVYYDYSDYRLFKKEIRLRSRDGKFELKIGDDEVLGIAEEIEDEKKIEQYLQMNMSLRDFIKNNLIVIIDYKQHRKKYRKDSFIIDVDTLDFGYSCVEIELLVENEAQISEAQTQIVSFAKQYGFEIGPQPTKRGEYFRLVKPAVYSELYEKNI